MQVETASLRAAAAGLRDTGSVVASWQARLRGSAGGTWVQGEPALAAALGLSLDGWARVAEGLAEVAGELARLLDGSADTYEQNDASLAGLASTYLQVGAPAPSLPSPLALLAGGGR